MSDWLLNKEEIIAIHKEQAPGQMLTIGIYGAEEAVAKAEVKKLMEWGDKPCIEHQDGAYQRRECYECWQAIKKE